MQHAAVIPTEIPDFTAMLIVFQTTGRGPRGTCMALFEQRWFAHRVNRSLLIHELEVDVSRCSGGEIAINLMNDNGGLSKDMNFTETNHGDTTLSYGSTILPE